MHTSKRHLWLDILKITACFLVIINHTHGQLIARAGLTNATALFDSISFGLCKVAVPLFMMTSGYLLLQKEPGYKKTLLRILRIAVPLVTVSCVHYILTLGKNGNPINFVGLFIKEPQSAHLWYLYTLLGVYVAVPFLAKMAQKVTGRDLALFVGAFLLLPAAARLLTTYTGYKVSVFFYDSVFPTAVAYLVAGLWLGKAPRKTGYFILSLVLYLAASLTFILTAYLSYLKTGVLSYTFDNWNTLPVAVASLSLFYIARFLFAEREFRPWADKFLGGISATTFGVYLIHILALNKMHQLAFIQSVYTINPYFGLIFVQIICFTGCSAIIAIARKIPGIRWFL